MEIVVLPGLVQPTSRAYRDEMRRIFGVLVLALALVASPAPAGADSKTTTDPLGGASSLLDLHRVKVTNNARGVRIEVRMNAVDWVKENPVGDFSMLIDTNHRRAGAEFGESFGIPGDGGFYARTGSKAHKRSWHTYPFPGRCGRTVVERWDLAAGRIIVHIRAKRTCLHHPKYVRVYVRTTQSGYFQDDSFVRNVPALIDHLPYRGKYTPWVRYSKK
jgi:hypothetical protein